MKDDRSSRGERGPFQASQIRPGDRYELSRGHPIWCAPTGGDGARRVGQGFAALASDPAVTEAGVDPGYSSESGQLRAPDVAIGNVPDAPGWIAGAPPLAVEYAGRGQDEAELQKKIGELLEAGTQWIWVVRLVGPRRVEVHEKGLPIRIVASGERLAAPGVLRNEVPVEALWDEDAANRHTLKNLLQRHGYQDLGAVREEGFEQGRAEGLEKGLLHARATLRRLAARRGLAISPDEAARIDACVAADQLGLWIERALDAASMAEVFTG